MSATGTFANVRPCMGLIVGPTLWAISTQAGTLWPSIECPSAHRYAAMACFAFAAAALAGTLVSWRCREGAGGTDVIAFPRSVNFVARLAALMGIVFSFVLVLQGTADLLLDACQR